VRRLTGNSQVIGEAGWWNDIVGVDKTIDVRKYTIVSLMCQVMVSIQLLSKIIEIL
jgi:homoserine acetyltransferase